MNHFFTVVLDLLCIIDQNGKFKRLNKSWHKVLGVSESEMLDKLYTDFIHIDDLESTAKAVEEMTKKGYVRDFVNRYRCKNGTYKYIEWSCILDKNDSIFCSAHDITQRLLDEQLMKESEARFRSIFEAANTGIAIIGKNDYFLMANNAFLNLVGYQKKQLNNTTLESITHPDDYLKAMENHQKLITNQIDRYRIEKRLISNNGGIKWIDVTVASIKNDDGNPIYFIAIFNDITERVVYEQQLKNINTTKDKFFSIIAHDLRNQFSAIHNISELLVLKRDSVEEKRDFFMSLLHNSGKSALTLLENLLEWSRSQINQLKLNLEEINVLGLTEEVLSVIDNQAILKSVKISVNIDSDHDIHGDRHMLSTVLRNFINNGIKFTPSGGEIIISSFSDKMNDFISIKDNGIGIPKHRIAKLFQVGSEKTTAGTEKEQGTGLGLILCKEFINMHKGDIIVKSQVNIGSEFIVSLPKYLSF
jgi:PAS domain S-box-containing protein